MNFTTMTDASPDLEEMKAYSKKLRSYSMDELEDVYFNIDILRHPSLYKLVVIEMERRNLHSIEHIPVTRNLDLRNWLARRKFFVNHRQIGALLIFLTLFIITTCVTLVFLSPIWVFAVPLKFTGLQAAIVYFACAPVPPILAAGVGAKLGGRGWYSISVLAGVAVGMALFNMTGTPSAIIRTIIQPAGPGGSGGFMSGF
jgi:hypothetical protein